MGRTGQVDLLELSGGNYESPMLLSNKASVHRNSDVSEAHQKVRESTKIREAFFLHYCREMVKALASDPRQPCGDNNEQIPMRIMLTGGFRSLGAMNAALGDGDCDLIGLGRPLCGSPLCVNHLVEASQSAKNSEQVALPSYENGLRAGNGLVRWLLGSFKLGQTVMIMAVQAWYYVRIYHLADGGSREPAKEVSVLAHAKVGN